jgi:thymidine kinase
MAKLYFRYGAMNCGKSTAVLQVAYNYEERDMHVLLIKPATDTKGDNQIVSRLGAARKVDILATPELDLFKVVSTKKQADPKISCILTDESQFFTNDQVSQLFNIAVKLGIPVICYGLRSDFQTKAFPGSVRLFELAHSLEELKTICRCGKKAILNGRKINGAFVASGSQVAIDGEESVTYESLCGNCYLKFVGPVSS